jgi:hypothetical protein
MSDAAAEFTRLKMLHADAVLLQEGGKPVVLLPKFAFVSGTDNVTMDVLLHPSPHSGYDSRLFFEHQIDGRKANWSQHRVLDRNWWAVSWEKVKPPLSWTAMLCEHLRAVA